MRTILVVTIMAGGLAAAGPAAHASDYGCRVLLCLSNPGGPMQYSECVPPITKLYSDLRRGKPMPTCPEVGFNGGGVGYGHNKEIVYVDLDMADGVKRVWVNQATVH